MLDENRLRHHGTQAAGTQEPGERGDEMNEKNDQIAHFIIVTKPGIACVVSQISNSPRDRASLSLSSLRTAKTDPARDPWKCGEVQAQLTVAFGAGQMYVAGRRRVQNGNSGSKSALRKQLVCHGFHPFV